MPKTTDKNKYFVVRERAVPEVLLNVVAAKKLLESKRAVTVQEAADAVGISRSSFTTKYLFLSVVFGILHFLPLSLRPANLCHYSRCIQT